MAAATVVRKPRRPCWTGTSEIYFAKPIDNSRLIKVDDPRRSQEMKHFGVALSVLFLLVMTFAWQHYKAIEYGYQIEGLKRQRTQLAETNSVLQMEESSLRNPGRIDSWARAHGLQPPDAGQIIRMDASSDAGGSVMASVTPVSVVSVP